MGLMTSLRSWNPQESRGVNEESYCEITRAIYYTSFAPFIRSTTLVDAIQQIDFYSVHDKLSRVPSLLIGTILLSINQGPVLSMRLVILALFFLFAATLEASRPTRSKQVESIRQSLQALTIDREANAKRILDKYERICEGRLARATPIPEHLGQGLDMYGVEVLLRKKVGLEKVDIVSAYQIIKNSKLGSLNPTKIFQDAIAEGYDLIIQCLQLVPFSKWDDLDEAHYFLARIYRTKTYDEAFWHRRWSESNYPIYLWTAFTANNPKFLRDMGSLPSINNPIRGPLLIPFFEKLEYVILNDASETLRFMLNKVPMKQLFDSIDIFAINYEGPKCLTLLYKIDDDFAKRVMHKAIKYDLTEIIDMVLEDNEYRVGAAEFDKAFRYSRSDSMGKIFNANKEAVMKHIRDPDMLDDIEMVSILMEECKVKFTKEEVDKVARSGKIKTAKIMRGKKPPLKDFRPTIVLISMPY